MNARSFYRLTLLFVIFATIISCSKDSDKEQGYYLIETLTNSSDVPVKVEIGGVLGRVASYEDFEKKPVGYRSLAYVPPKQTVTLDSTFICTKNCEMLLNQGDPAYEPLFLKLTFNDKVKIDTNCRHIYVSGGFIKNCPADKKSYFNQQNHTVIKNKSGNIVNDYTISNDDLADAK